MSYVYLALAIVAEVIATSALKASNGFTSVVPSIIVVVGYSIAFYCLALVIKVIPVGIAYAIWGGLGIVLVALAGVVLFDQTLDLAAIIGMTFIIVGIVIVNLFSNSLNH